MAQASASSVWSPSYSVELMEAAAEEALLTGSAMAVPSQRAKLAA